jgi:hypothetical protein
MNLLRSSIPDAFQYSNDCGSINTAATYDENSWNEAHVHKLIPRGDFVSDINLELNSQKNFVPRVKLDVLKETAARQLTLLSIH